ncbi:MAG: alpha/beta fold hydrolase, partial [Bdellovibrionales bacterium]
MNSPLTWILLRGLSREVGHWGSFVEDFSKRFPDQPVLAIDLPGFGEFRSEVSPSSIQDIMTRVRAHALARAPSQSRFAILALSLGGMVAMEWLRSRPEEIERCILVNTSSSALNSPLERLRWQVWGRMVGMVAQTAPRKREAALADLLINSPEGREA